MPAVLGLDFGTSSVRALIVDAADGRPLGSASAPYTHGSAGVITSPLDPLLARQHPGDYIESMAAAVRAATAQARDTNNFHPADFRAIGVDTTGSTPIPVDRSCMPLAMLPEFAGDTDAMAWLWKDHTAHAEAAEITALAKEQGRPYLSKCGGTYSSEWYWSKVLRCRRTNPKVAAAAASWLEFCDFIPAYLCGITDPAKVRRGICAAGHKGMYHESWGGLPAAEFLDALAPGLSRLRGSYAIPALTADRTAGQLSPQAAAHLGLSALLESGRSIPVTVGALDAHLGAVGSGCSPGTLVKIIGTSTCDCIVVPESEPLADIPGVCGIVPGSILPGHFGIEAGQSAVGDIFDWFVSRILGHGPKAVADAHASLMAAAARLAPGESGLLTLDWHNGNRTILVDPLLTGLTLGQTLATTPAELYRSLVEATAFGARMIIDRLASPPHLVPIDRIICCGGVAEKNPLLMQIYADVLRRPMHTAGSDQACALGSAIMASVAAGIHPSVLHAQRAMTTTKGRIYHPDPAAAGIYDRLFALYQSLHDAFGLPGHRASLGRIMKQLLVIRQEATAAR